MSKVIQQQVTLKATPAQVFKALMDSEQFSQAAGGAATVNNSTDGGAFSCFGGMITGRNIELIPGQRIVQAWRVKMWPEGTYSIAKFELNSVGSETRLDFEQHGFPEGQIEHLTAGWLQNYWQPLEKFFATQSVPA